MKLIRWLLLVALVSPVMAQNVRWDLPIYTTQAQGGNLLPVYAIPGAGIKFYSCSGSTCTTLATTYISATSATTCPVSPTPMQVTLQGSSVCVASADPFGNMGAWFQAGQYMATIVAQGQSYNYYFTIGGGGGSGTVTAVSVATANGFQGTSSGGATPVLTLNVDGTHILPVNTGAATNFLNQAGGYTVPAGSNPLTTKGDLFGFSTVPARIPIGADNLVLTADSTQALGLGWKSTQAITTLTGDVTGTGPGVTTTTLAKIAGVPFCTGFSPTTGQSLTYTTASSPNPCYTAATSSGGVSTIGVTTANGVSGTSSGGANPSLTIALGAITPSSVNATGPNPMGGTAALIGLGAGTFGSGSIPAGVSQVAPTSVPTGYAEVLPSAVPTTGQVRTVTAVNSVPGGDQVVEGWTTPSGSSLPTATVPGQIITATAAGNTYAAQAHIFYAQASDTFASINSECSSPCTYIVTIPQTLSDTGGAVLNANVNVDFEADGVWTLTGGSYIAITTPIRGTITKHFIPTGDEVILANGEVPLEWFGGVGDGSTDNQSAFTAALASLYNPGYVTLQGGLIYNHSGTITISSNGQNIKSIVPIGNPSGNPVSTIRVTSATADNIDVAGTYNTDIENVVLARSVLPSPSSTAAGLSEIGVWTPTVKNVVSIDNIYDYYYNGLQNGNFYDDRANWTLSGYSSSYTTAAGIFLDSLNNGPSPSPSFYNQSLNGGTLISGGGVADGVLIKGLQVLDSEWNNTNLAAGLGIHIDYTGTSANQPCADIHFTQTTIDGQSSTKHSIWVQNCNPTNSSKSLYGVEFNGGYAIQNGGPVVEIDSSAGVQVNDMMLGGQASNAVNISGGYSNVISNITTSNQSSIGVNLLNTTENTVTGVQCYLIAASECINLTNSTDNTIVGNTFNGSGGSFAGISADSASQSTNDVGLNACNYAGTTVTPCYNNIPALQQRLGMGGLFYVTDDAYGTELNIGNPNRSGQVAYQFRNTIWGDMNIQGASDEVGSFDQYYSGGNHGWLTARENIMLGFINGADTSGRVPVGGFWLDPSYSSNKTIDVGSYGTYGSPTRGDHSWNMHFNNLTLDGSCTGCGSMVYPGAGIPNSTGSAWGTSYGVSGTGSVALTASPTFTGTVTAAAITATNLTDSALTSGQMVKASTGGLLTSLDFPQQSAYPAASCNNATATALWSIGSAGTVTCKAGTNNKTAYAAISSTAGTYAQFIAEIPTDWDSSSNPSISFEFAMPTGSSAVYQPAFQVACMGTVGSTDDIAFNAQHTWGTVTNTVVNRFTEFGVQLNSTDMTGCSAGSTMVIEVEQGSSSTATANFYSARMSFPRMITAGAL